MMRANYFSMLIAGKNMAIVACSRLCQRFYILERKYLSLLALVSADTSCHRFLQNILKLFPEQQ
jgi:hypothetical protein